MRTFRFYLLLAFALLLLAVVVGPLLFVPTTHAQNSAGTPFPFQIGLSWPAQAAGSGSFGAFDVRGLQYFSLDWVVSGSPTCSVTLDGNSSLGGSFSTGSIVSAQNCGSTGSLTTSSATHNLQAQLSYTITGSGSVTFIVRGYALNPTSSPCLP